LFLVPLINIEKLKLKLMRTLLPKSYLISSKGYDKLPDNQCAICHDNASSSSNDTSADVPLGQLQDYSVHNPYQANCGHTYCYYCIQSKIVVFGDEWPCLRCGEKVESIQKLVCKVEDTDKDEKDANGEDSNGAEKDEKSAAVSSE
jgi:peroxin-2